MSVTGLSVEHKSKRSFVDILQYVLNEAGPQKILFSGNELVPNGPMYMLPYACMDIPLSGLKHMVFASDGQTQDVLMKPGEIHYCPPMCWKRSVWDFAHEMSSVVFNPDYIRITYINHTRDMEKTYPGGASIFYHTSRPLGKTGKAILQALNIMGETGREAGAAALTRSLLEVVLDELIHDNPRNDSKAHDTWLRMCHYLRENCQSPINRAHAAQVFNLNPSYVSRLFTSEGGESFTSMLRRLRLEHAAMLLKNTRMSIDEITDNCGYLSSTFFISTFKRHYGVTPGAYRKSGK
jgi:AraC-like DNA-binding protein